MGDGVTEDWIAPQHWMVQYNEGWIIETCGDYRATMGQPSVH